MKVATCEIILFWCIKIIQYKLVPSFTKCLPIILKFTHLGEHTLSNQEDPCYFLADKEIYKSINTRVNFILNETVYLPMVNMQRWHHPLKWGEISLNSKSTF